jgi:hypothetical protein
VIESLARAYPLVEYVAVVVVTYPEWICRVSAQTRVAPPAIRAREISSRTEPTASARTRPAIQPVPAGAGVGAIVCPERKEGPM